MTLFCLTRAARLYSLTFHFSLDNMEEMAWSEPRTRSHDMTSSKRLHLMLHHRKRTSHFDGAPAKRFALSSSEEPDAKSIARLIQEVEGLVDRGEYLKARELLASEPNLPNVDEYEGVVRCVELTLGQCYRLVFRGRIREAADLCAHVLRQYPRLGSFQLLQELCSLRLDGAHRGMTHFVSGKVASWDRILILVSLATLAYCDCDKMEFPPDHDQLVQDLRSFANSDFQVALDKGGSSEDYQGPAGCEVRHQILALKAHVAYRNGHVDKSISLGLDTAMSGFSSLAYFTTAQCLLIAEKHEELFQLLNKVNRNCFMVENCSWETKVTAKLDEFLNLYNTRRRMEACSTPHDILEVPLTANPQDIRAAYRQMARKFHPDKVKCLDNRSLASHVFKVFSTAYGELNSI